MTGVTARSEREPAGSQAQVMWRQIAAREVNRRVEIVVG